MRGVLSFFLAAGGAIAMGELLRVVALSLSLSLSVLSQLGATNECLRGTITPSRALNWVLPASQTDREDI